MGRCVWTACLLGLLTASLSEAHAQEPPPATPAAQRPGTSRLDERNLPECSSSEKQMERENGHLRHLGQVSCVLQDGARVGADTIDVYAEDNSTRIVAEGHVTFSGPDGHISAERLEYHTATGNGVFEIASGFLTLGPGVDRRPFGNQEPQIEFYGQRLEKLGPRRFRVWQGGWSACVQTTPRWSFTTTSMVLELDNYVIARNTVLRVKGVPLVYWPYLYYPIQSDDRATGFLLPTYGTSTFRGPTFSNAFFWAIDRSQDATFFHDWFTRAGQGAGGEYRYVASPESSGTVRLYRFWRSETTFEENGVSTTLPASTGVEVNGSLIQHLGPGIIGRARVDYFSDIVSQQLLHQNFNDTSQRNRLVEGSVTVTRGPWSGGAFFQRNEVINTVNDTLLYGSAPRVNAALAPQRLFGSPVYASFTTDLAYLPYEHRLGDLLLQDNSFGRFDAMPSIRVPLSKLTYLSVNVNAAYRTTYYTRHASETPGQLEEGSFFRQYATLRTEMVGPVLSRIFDLKDSSFAERVKHVIEPAVTMDLTSSIDDFRKTPLQTDVSDFVIGGTSRVTYGATSRLFLRKPTVGGARGATREFLTVGLQQTAYSNPESSRYDPSYSSSVGGGAGQTFSPIALTARVSPDAAFDGNLRAEYDVNLGLQVLTTGAGVNFASGGLNVNYSRQRIDRTQPANSFVSGSTHMQFLQNRVTTSYSINMDLARSYVVSQGIIGSYMAQCCGFQAEYQQYNYPGGFGLPFTRDTRVNFSFTLAGLGTFSNFFGAFGGS